MQQFFEVETISNNMACVYRSKGLHHARSERVCVSIITRDPSHAMIATATRDSTHAENDSMWMLMEHLDDTWGDFTFEVSI